VTVVQSYLIMKLRNILSRPLSLFFGTLKKPNVQVESKQKPQEVIVVQTKGAKAAFFRDWVMASFFALFAGVTVYDKILKANQVNNLEAIVRDLDLNKDGKISKEELETVRELINVIEKRTTTETQK